MRTIVHYQTIPTPKGDIVVIATEKAIVWASTPGGSIADGEAWVRKHIAHDIELDNENTSILKRAREELTAYFKGEDVVFSGPFDLLGTPFQQSVWREMLKIPYGKTITYAEMARKIHNPKAVRAVGGACRSNPVAILNPCHRIIGSDKSLTGYAGKSGVATKKWLLELEQHVGMA